MLATVRCSNYAWGHCVHYPALNIHCGLHDHEKLTDNPNDEDSSALGFLALLSVSHSLRFQHAILGSVAVFEFTASSDCGEG